MKKRRVTFKLEEDEAIVIAPLSFWQGVESHFEAIRDEAPEDYYIDWSDAIDHIKKWVEKTKDTRKLSEEDE